MSTRTRQYVLRTISVAVAAATVTILSPVGEAYAAVRPGSYTSTTWSAGIILLQREGRVQNGELVLIGRYRIHPTRNGGYVDFFPGHRVIMNSDGRGGYQGPAFLGGVDVGRFTLTPR